MATASRDVSVRYSPLGWRCAAFMKKALVSRQHVAVHPSSVLFSRRCSCVVFNELLYTTKLYMRDLTQIDPEWLPEVAPHFYAAGTAPAQNGHSTRVSTAVGRGAAR